jgi:hypothetical protein
MLSSTGLVEPTKLQEILLTFPSKIISMEDIF